MGCEDILPEERYTELNVRYWHYWYQTFKKEILRKEARNEEKQKADGKRASRS